MADWGIDTRKWLVFGLFAALLSILIQYSAFFGPRHFYTPGPLELSITLLLRAVQILALVVLADLLSRGVRDWFHLRVQRRYLAFLVLALTAVVLTLTRQSGPSTPGALSGFFGEPVGLLVSLAMALAAATLVLVVYMICDLAADFILSHSALSGICRPTPSASGPRPSTTRPTASRSTRSRRR